MKPHVTRDRKEMFKDNKYTHTVCVNQVLIHYFYHRIYTIFYRIQTIKTKKQ